MASSSTSSPSIPSFSSRSWRYDVFLSFRGEDIRHTFVYHLYTALVQNGIYTYKDDETLPLGDSISPSLMNTIEESKIAVILFSINYAKSSRCLDELLHIMKCKDTRDQLVMPIFYDVEPNEVRKQNRNYEEAFQKHELVNSHKVDAWRKALADAANISGWEIKQIGYGHETYAIKKIVTEILWKFDRPVQISSPINQITSEDLIGMKDRVKDLEPKLQIEFGGVSMVGIIGVGGGGKTSLAYSIYAEIYWMFDGFCFIKNIMEMSRDNGLEKLQEQILYNVLKEKRHQVRSVDEGKSMIKRRLCHKKVLIVLDDVDDLDHLQALAGSHDWFGVGSIIIITTRDEHVLTAHGVDVIHNIRLLNNDEAIGLFRKYAYPRYKAMEDYEQRLKDLASIEVVSYAGGLPLALKVLGEFLFELDINKWRSAFARLILMPDQKSHIRDLVDADMKNRRLLHLNIEHRVQATRALPENLPPAELVDAIIKPLFPNEDIIILEDMAYLKIPLQDIVVATNNFSEEHFIAWGGFGKVYRAQYEDRIVAIKRLDTRFGQGDREFKMEIQLLSAYKHENLVSLVGFCEEDGQKILVYKYESNGSLDRYLHRKDLTWTQRIQICLDAARGLKYLHDDIGIQHRILHRDMKSSNILLDKNFRAKISDFGLSKITLANVPYTVVISACVGTPGYVDPEYFKRGELTQKSDVYSFGVVMFEVLCGKLASVKQSDEPSLAEEAQNHYEKGSLVEFIDSDLRGQMELDSLTTFSDIAYQCLKCPAKERPRMVAVVKELEKALDFQRVVSKK